MRLLNLWCLAVLVMVLLVTGCGRISEGNVGVRTAWNQTVYPNEVPPGFYVAVFDSVREYVGKEIEIGFDNLTPKAGDNLSLTGLDISIHYRPNTANIAEFVVKYSGMSTLNSSNMVLPGARLVDRIARGVIYDTIAKHDSLTLHTKRNVIESMIVTDLQKKLDEAEPGMFHIIRAVVRQALTDPSIEESIRTTVQMKKQTEAKQYEKELAIAEAERKVEEATGIKQYNELIAQSITPELLEFKRIEAMREFAREGTHTVLIPNDIKPLITVK